MRVTFIIFLSQLHWKTGSRTDTRYPGGMSWMKCRIVQLNILLDTSVFVARLRMIAETVYDAINLVVRRPYGKTL